MTNATTDLPGLQRRVLIFLAHPCNRNLKWVMGRFFYFYPMQLRHYKGDASAKMKLSYKYSVTYSCLPRRGKSVLRSQESKPKKHFVRREKRKIPQMLKSASVEGHAVSTRCLLRHTRNWLCAANEPIEGFFVVLQQWFELLST